VMSLLITFVVWTNGLSYSRITIQYLYKIFFPLDFTEDEISSSQSLGYQISKSLYLNFIWWTHRVAFDGAAWYWHFVDVIWLVVLLAVYWWASTLPTTDLFQCFGSKLILLCCT
jgi:hypothetical protein